MIKNPYSKYKNRRVLIDGITFASQREANRYLELKLLEKAKQISHLSLQPRFVLLNKFVDVTGKKHRGVEYVADFEYIDKKHGFTVEDCKGMKTDVYRLKIKFFLSQYKHRFIES